MSLRGNLLETHDQVYSQSDAFFQRMAIIMAASLNPIKTLRVVMTTGQLHYIEVYPGETVGDIRSLLSDRYGYPHDQMRFTLRGNPVTDETSCDSIEHSVDDYLKCQLSTETKRSFTSEPPKPKQFGNHHPLIHEKEVARPKPERQKQSIMNQQTRPPRPVVVNRANPVHRIIAPSNGARKSQSTTASSIRMLLTNSGETQ